MRPITYREPDFTFGQLMLKLRMAIGLTQAGLAELLGVSRRAVGEWEGGQSYPKTAHLKKFIAFCLKQQGFSTGREAEEIRALWQAAHQKVLLDELWLFQLLHHPAPPQIAELHQPSSPQMVELTQPVNSPGKIQDVDSSQEVSAGSERQLDWGEAIDIPTFYGRKSELAQLSRWVVEEHCRVVSVLGLGGIGKTTLTATLMHQIAGHFEVVIWRSLRDAPFCQALVDGYLQVLSPDALPESSASFEERLSQLLKHLQARRVLLVLDNIETILEEGHDVGYMRRGYESYGRLLRLVAETGHKSCLLLTSREKPVDLVVFEGSHSPVRSLRLSQLDAEACEQLLLDKDTTGTSQERAQLREILAGNPLALKIVAQTIVDLFEGEIALFLEQGEAIFGGVKDLLDRQYDRLSPSEQTVLFWLAIIREPATLNEVMGLLVKPLQRMQLLEVIEALHRRSLIERGEKPGTFTLQSVVLEYMTSRLVQEVADELVQGNLNRLIEHCLVQAHAKDYVRHSQQRVIIRPLLARFKSPYNNSDRLETYLRQTLDQVQQMPQAQQGYAGGNTINLLVAVGSDLHGWDFSGLNLWEAYLVGVELRNVNLAGADLGRSSFNEGFNSILGLVFSPDSKFLAGGDLAGNIKIWQLPQPFEGFSYPLVVEGRGHSDAVSSVAYSPDSRFLVSGSHDRTVRLWDAHSGENLAVLKGHTDAVCSVAFSPDGRVVASGGLDRTIRLWQTATGELLTTLQGHENFIWAVAFSPTGNILASCGLDGTVRLWELNLPARNASLVATLSGHTGLVYQIAFSPDGQILYSCGPDGTIRLWDITARKHLHTLDANNGAVQAIAVSPDGTTLAGGGYDRNIRLWRPASEKPFTILSGNTAPIVGLAFSPDGQTLASCSSDGSWRLWSVERGEVLTTIQGYSNFIFSVATHSKGAYLAGAGGNNRVALWRLNAENEPSTSQPVTPSVVLKGHTNQLMSVAFSSDGARLASAGQDGFIKIWDLARVENGSPARLTLMGHTELINTLAFTPEGNMLASGSVDGTVRLWSVITGELMGILQGHQGTVWSVTFSPDGSTLASGGNDGTVRLWDPSTGQLRESLELEKAPITNLLYHPKGHFLAGAMYDGTIRLWPTAGNNQPSQTLKANQSAVWSLAFSPEPTASSNLLSGGADGIARLWNIETGEEVAQYAHDGLIRSVAFTPDGAGIISAGEGGLVKLWDNPGRKIVAIYRDFQPYEGVNIRGASGLTAAQRATLLAFGAVEN